MKCFAHEEREAVAACTICGKGVCSDCLARKKGKTVCPECLVLKGYNAQGLGLVIWQLIWGVIATPLGIWIAIDSGSRLGIFLIILGIFFLVLGTVNLLKISRKSRS